MHAHLPMVLETVEQAIVMVDRAYIALCEAEHFQQTREIRNVAIAAAAYAREAKDTRLIDKATELRTRAERKAGQMLREAAIDGARANLGRPDKTSNDATFSKPTLAQIGVTRDQSSKWQQAAKLTDDEFEEALAMTKAITHEVSTAKVMQIARGENKRQRIEVVDDDDVIVVREPAPPSHEDQAVAFYNALESLHRITCSAAELQQALPFYQHFRIVERMLRSLALLQEVERSWNTT